jgi:hypothetical protein
MRPDTTFRHRDGAWIPSAVRVLTVKRAVFVRVVWAAVAHGAILR